jgi:pyruvate-formate lyase
MEKPFALEFEFTEIYRAHATDHPAIREAACLKVLYPALFEPIRKGDLFAGRINYRAVGFGLELASGGPGYYCHDYQLNNGLNRISSPNGTRGKVKDMIRFWGKEATIRGRLFSMLPPKLRTDTENLVGNMEGRLAGALLDFDKLVRVGLPGLADEIADKRSRCRAGTSQAAVYAGMLSALGTLEDTLAHYSRQARELTADESDRAWRNELKATAETLDAIRIRRPESLREALQLGWLYALISGVVNYGRIDVWAGDFLARDLDTGRIDEKRALALVQSVWRLVVARQIWFNGRIIVGGRGRRNVRNADQFALLAMEATRTVVETEPQLTLRFHRGQDPRLMEKALDVIGAGRTFPMLYNDDVNVPAVRNAFRVGTKAAEQYLPYGCGEYALDHVSFGSPNCSYNLLKALEITLFNGTDPLSGKALGLKTGRFESMKTFARLMDAYRRQAEFFAGRLATRHAIEYKAEASSATFLFASMLYDDCIARGKSVVDGGVRYRGGVIESFGVVNTADSLAAIKYAVYDKKLLTHSRLLAALRADFKGFDRERRILMEAPKYGNDEAYVDDIAAKVSSHAARHIMNQARRIGFHYFLMVNINNLANVQFGPNVGATPDGRRHGDPLANGNNPTAGNDRKGATAFLNSLVRLDPKVHAGYVQNMKFSKRMFTAERPKLEALLGTYFTKGGAQAMITVLDRGDLEAAMKEPGKYANLMVRIGGYSHRFVELPKNVQRDVANRTLY